MLIIICLLLQYIVSVSVKVLPIWKIFLYSTVFYGMDADPMAKWGEMDGSCTLFTEELRHVAWIPFYPPFSCGHSKGRLASVPPGISPTQRDEERLGQFCSSDPLFTPVQPGTHLPSSSISTLPSPEALAQAWPGLWSASGPAAHCVKGPAAPCHTAHLPSRRPECGIREERHTERSRNPELLSSLLTSPHEPAYKRCAIMWVAMTLEKLWETNKMTETNSGKIMISQGRRCFSSAPMILETSDGWTSGPSRAWNSLKIASACCASI